MQETQVQSQAREDALEKEMATRSSILAWRIPWTEEPLWVHKEPLTPSSAENFTIAFPTTRGRASVGNIITDFISARWIQLKKGGGVVPQESVFWRPYYTPTFAVRTEALMVSTPKLTSWLMPLHLSKTHPLIAFIPTPLAVVLRTSVREQVRALSTQMRRRPAASPPPPLGP